MGASESAIVESALYVEYDVEEVVAVPAGDAALVARLKRGERAAYEEFVGTYQGVVYGLAYRLLGDPEDARDVAQETFLKAYRYIATFRGESGLKTWLYRMTVNQVSNHHRWWRRRCKKETISLDGKHDGSESTIGDRLACSGCTPEQAALAREREARLMEALEALKHDYRAAVVLRDIEELSYDEIAEALSIPVGTVKSRIARAREELRRRLREMGV